MSTQDTPLRIIELRAENTKRLKAVRIAPDGDVVTIAGRNGQGKTSVLDAIALGLEGGAVSVDRPVRAGQEKGAVVVDLGDIVVTRRWTKGGESSTVKVQQRVGENLATLDKPQAVLDRLVGRVALDPLRFARMGAKERREELLRLAPLDVDLADLARRRKAAFEARTDARREADQLEAQAKGIPAIVGEPEVEISVSDLAAEMRQVQELNAETARLGHEVQRAEAEHVAARALVQRLRDELSAAEKREAAAASTLQSARAAHGSRSILSLETVQRQMEQAEASNRMVRDRNAQRIRRAEILERLRVASDRSVALSAEIESIDQAKADALARTEMPIDGLGIEDADVTLRGIPFGDLAASEKIKVGLALGLAANPRLRVVLVRDGSLLDEDSRAVLARWAGENEAQVWIEVVGDGGDGAIVIEDGEVVGAEATTAVGGA